MKSDWFCACTAVQRVCAALSDPSSGGGASSFVSPSEVACARWRPSLTSRVAESSRARCLEVPDDARDFRVGGWGPARDVLPVSRLRVGGKAAQVLSAGDEG
jgi:hypothetical protein